MREKYLWLAIAVLTALSLGQACYIYERQVSAGETSGPPPLRPEIHKSLYEEKAYDSRWEEFEKWREKTRSSIQSGQPLGEKYFDAFFDDRFFSRRYSPFTELERIHREVSGQFAGQERVLFDSYWDRWFEQRMRMGPFRTDVLRSDRDVTIVVRIPGLVDGSAAADIAEGRIKLTFRARPDYAPGGEAKEYLKLLPVPADADPATGKSWEEGERVKIKFGLKRAEGVGP